MPHHTIEKVKKFFIDNTNHKEEEIENIEEVKDGFTNDSFRFDLKGDKKYLVRIGNHKINRDAEKEMIHLFEIKDFVYYDDKKGDAIKKWIPGHCPTIVECRQNEFIKLFIQKLEQLQKADIKNTKLQLHPHYIFIDKSDLNNDYRNAYMKLLEKYKDLPLVACHCDLRPSNLIYDKENKDLYFIDYEWACLNNKYWDLCNFLRELNYPVNDVYKYSNDLFKDFDSKLIVVFLFVCTCYAYQWTFFPEYDEMIAKYRENVKNLMDEYYEHIVDEI